MFSGGTSSDNNKHILLNKKKGRTVTTPVKILVANRGEIAIRIIRAIQELNHEAVAIYETPDQHSKHIRIANEAVWIGDGPRSDYLNIEKVIKAAKRSGATALHPGYGFLAENPLLAKACEEAGITFIGPSSEVIEKLGNNNIRIRIQVNIIHLHLFYTMLTYLYLPILTILYKCYYIHHIQF